jgi:hypothetical protein
VCVEGEPVGSAAEFCLGGRIGLGQEELQLGAVFEVSYGNHTGPGLHAIHEAQDVADAEVRVVVAAEEERRCIPGAAAREGLHTRDKLVGLRHGIDMALDAVINTGEHSGAVGRGEEGGAFGVKVAAFACARDQTDGAVGAQGGEIARRVTAAFALLLLGIVGGDVDDLRQAARDLRAGRLGISGSGRRGGRACGEEKRE